MSKSGDLIHSVHRGTVLSWASAEAGGNGSTYKEELVEFFPHGLADVLLHQWEHLHKVLRQRVGGVAGPCGYLQIDCQCPAVCHMPHPSPHTSSVRLASLWLLLWSVLPMADIRPWTTCRRSSSSAKFKSWRARILVSGEKDRNNCGDIGREKSLSPAENQEFQQR